MVNAARSVFCVPRSAFWVPCSAFCVLRFVFRVLCSVFCVSRFAFRVLRSGYQVRLMVLTLFSDYDIGDSIT